MKTLEVKVFSINELSDGAKEKAIEASRQRNVDDSYWYEFINDDVKEIGKIIGLEIKDVFFSGFSSQGNGACFTGNYAYAKNAPKKIRGYAPLDQTLHTIADRLQTLQRKFFYSIYATVEHRGHYYDEKSMVFYIESERHNPSLYEDELQDIFEDFAIWIYKTLEREYEYQTSDEAIIESLESNEIEFLGDGSIF